MSNKIKYQYPILFNILMQSDIEQFIYANQYNIQAAEKNDQADADDLYDMVRADDKGNDLLSRSFRVHNMNDQSDHLSIDNCNATTSLDATNVNCGWYCSSGYKQLPS